MVYIERKWRIYGGSGMKKVYSANTYIDGIMTNVMKGAIVELARRGVV